MRKFVFVLLAFMAAMTLVTTGCTDGRRPTSDTDSVVSVDSDSIAEDSAESLIASTPMPKAADELFDDFIFNFAANRKLQYSRIVFPLQVYYGDKAAKQIGRGQWKMEHFFMRQDYYTLIFDNQRQMSLVKDTSVNSVAIEKIYLNRKSVKQYLFDRIDGQWMMTGIKYIGLSQSQNASFLNFYNAFATDTAYQYSHISNPLKFSGPDPDDDFSTMQGDLLPEQWPAFASLAVLPTGMIYNIIYGQKYSNSKTKLFLIRGIANGLEQEFTFRHVNGKWYLAKLNI